VLRLLTILTACALMASLLFGCGDGGARSGATVSVYVSAPLRGEEAKDGRHLCDEAREQAAQGGGGDELKLRVVCLDAAGAGGSWTLARVGSNARRATEDSTTIAYIGEPDPKARKQSQPIVEAAEIADLGGLSGRDAIARVTAAIRDGDEAEPRQAVFDAVEG
jgi:branched-chain amino acid transport system substrate-binding protein